MRGKCYPHLGDFKSGAIAPQGFKRPAWRILDRLSGDLYVLSQTQNSIVRYAPRFIHSFVLCAPRKILEATQFNQRYRRYEEIDNVPDRLRWCRHSKGLMQVEVADKVGKKPFARKMGIPVRCLQEWESGRKVISIKCWERHFKGRA